MRVSTMTFPNPFVPLAAATPSAFATGESLSVRVAADVRDVAAAVRRFDLGGHVLRVFAALGASDRVLVANVSGEDAPPGGLAVKVRWRVEDEADQAREAASVETPEGHIDARYAIEVRPSGEHESLVSVSSRYAANDPYARGRLLDGWFAMRALADAIGRRALAAVTADVDAAAEAA
jgi:hypothetical protein